MSTFKDRESNTEIKRILKVLDVEKDAEGKITNLIVEDTAYNEDLKEQGTPIKADKLNEEIKRMIRKTFMTPKNYAEYRAAYLIKTLEDEYTTDAILETDDDIIVVWSVEGEYGNAIDIVEGNKLVFNREIYDIEFRLKVTVVYQGCTSYKYGTARLKGLGTAGYTDPYDVILELVKNITTYDRNFELPVVDGATWSLVDPNENEVILEGNKVTILGVPGDNRVEFYITVTCNNKTATEWFRISLNKPYICETKTMEIDQSFGELQSNTITVYSPANKKLNLKVKDPSGNFDIAVLNNNTKSVSVKITEKETLNSTRKTGFDEFDLTIKVDSNYIGDIHYGTETLKIKYNYQQLEYDETTTYWNKTSNNSNVSSFLIKSATGDPLYATVSYCDANLNAAIISNGTSDIAVKISENKFGLIGPDDVTIEYKVIVRVYSDSIHLNLIENIEYTIIYMATSTDPTD